MKGLEELPRFLRQPLQRIGVSFLYPPQAEALRRGLLEGRRMMVATPTASGKTLIAMMAAYKHLVEGGKVLYLTPLRALAAEKLQEFSEFLGKEYSVIASTGDYDSADPWLESFDVIVATNEKADSLMRHRASWIKRISLVVADEVHLLGDPDRGPTLEMTLTRLLNQNPETQFLGLSATAPNAYEIAEWLSAELVSMEWRPVPLREGIYLEGHITYSDGRKREVKQFDYNPAISLALQTVMEGGQAIIFANTRKKAEQYAEKASSALQKNALLSDDDRKYLKEVSEQIEQEAEASAFNQRLASLIRAGACFHHAGLASLHRRAVEKAFKERRLKIICATPTLAAGVNLPARTVIIPELRRYELGEGLKGISVTEYKQFCGRAGRPGYDEYGEAVTIARNMEEKELIFERYVKGMPERIWSKLASEKHLRIQVLGVLASEEIRTFESLANFFTRTLLSHQFGSSFIKKSLEKVLNFLVENSFVKEDGLEATLLGRRVSELYIDPLTALTIIKKCSKRPGNVDDVGLLQLICMTDEVPSVPMRRIEAWRIQGFLNEYYDSFFEVPDPREDPDEYDLFIDSLKTTILMKGWIEEVGEGEIYEVLGVEPGDLAVLRERCSWIAYAASELMAIERKTALQHAFAILSERLEKGVKPELLPLTSLHGVGRVRARNLYNAGYKTLDDLRRASPEELARVTSIGERTAQIIKNQL